uniref:Uncharacterized protein n=1 Tax=Timema bartmani TaxID=61472 RepID=A0A7R9I6V5_9NEOP|nr:unnamed protein product [Timema bartmani]
MAAPTYTDPELSPLVFSSAPGFRSRSRAEHSAFRQGHYFKISIPKMADDEKHLTQGGLIIEPSVCPSGDVSLDKVEDRQLCTQPRIRLLADNCFHTTHEHSASAQHPGDDTNNIFHNVSLEKTSDDEENKDDDEEALEEIRAEFRKPRLRPIISQKSANEYWRNFNKSFKDGALLEMNNNLLATDLGEPPFPSVDSGVSIAGRREKIQVQMATDLAVMPLQKRSISNATKKTTGVAHREDISMMEDLKKALNALPSDENNFGLKTKETSPLKERPAEETDPKVFHIHPPSPVLSESASVDNTVINLSTQEMEKDDSVPMTPLPPEVIQKCQRSRWDQIMDRFLVGMAHKKKEKRSVEASETNTTRSLSSSKERSTAAPPGKSSNRFTLGLRGRGKKLPKHPTSAHDAPSPDEHFN